MCEFMWIQHPILRSKPLAESFCCGGQTAGTAARNRRILFPVTLCLHASTLDGLNADSFAATIHSRVFPAVLALHRSLRWVADKKICRQSGRVFWVP